MQPLISTLLSLINSVAVIMVIAYALTRSALFKRVWDRTMTWRDRLLLMLIFGLLSIYGTLSGFQILGGIASIRDLGPVLAGLLAGPVVGLGAGILGGVHRYLQGGFTALPCTIAPIIAGLSAGIIYTLRRGRRLPMIWAVVFMVFVEFFHMGITVWLATPRQEALALVENVIFPIVSANAIGMAIFVYLTENLLKERAVEKIKMTMEGELRVAHDIQMSLVPKTFPPVPHRDEFSLYAALEPAREVGGDLYDFYFVGDNRFFFMIGDVAGKGMPAALFMAVTRTVIKARMQPADAGLGVIMSRVNQSLCDGNDAGMFVTAFCGFLDVLTGEVTYINAGHNPPALIQADGRASFLKITPNIPLGVMDDMIYHEEHLHLGEGDMLVLYTDGVTEATNRRKEFFTEENLLKVLDGCRGLSPGGVVGKILAAVHQFAAGAAPADDITLLTLKMEEKR